MGKRTILQSAIAYIIYGVISFIILVYFGLIDFPLYVAASVTALLIKDLIDLVMIIKGKGSIGGIYFEHAPYVLIVSFYGLIMGYSFEPFGWALYVAIADSVLDVGQDLISLKTRTASS